MQMNVVTCPEMIRIEIDGGPGMGTSSIESFSTNTGNCTTTFLCRTAVTSICFRGASRTLEEGSGATLADFLRAVVAPT